MLLLDEFCLHKNCAAACFTTYGFKRNKHVLLQRLVQNLTWNSCSSFLTCCSHSAMQRCQLPSQPWGAILAASLHALPDMDVEVQLL